MRTQPQQQAACVEVERSGAEWSDLMLLCRTRFTTMRLFTWMMMLSALTVVATAQPPCDPHTQYVHQDQCCQLCPPGTSMSSVMSSCLNPQCHDCENNEYQEEYSKESICQRQPFCDSNKNFDTPVHDRRKKSVCLCKEGFHCSAEDCITCVPHTPCQPGHGVKSKGSHTQDTVCERCHHGTYSNESSTTGVCKKWTECESGSTLKKNGTEVSDSICAKEPTRTHVIGVGVCVTVLLLLLLCGGVLWLCRGNRGHLKDCVESCRGDKMDKLREAMPITTTADQFEEELTLPEAASSQEEGFLRTPVENEDEQADLLLTDNGKIVTQENGKTETLSRQESQTQAAGDEFIVGTSL